MDLGIRRKSCLGHHAVDLFVRAHRLDTAGARATMTSSNDAAAVYTWSGFFASMCLAAQFVESSSSQMVTPSPASCHVTYRCGCRPGCATDRGVGGIPSFDDE